VKYAASVLSQIDGCWNVISAQSNRQFLSDRRSREGVFVPKYFLIERPKLYVFNGSKPGAQ
jgi:hypothetical protein